jgi:hypothetical protein
VLLLYATAIPVHATTITVTNTNDSGPGSSTFTRDYSCIASTSRTDIRSDGNQNAYVARGLYPAIGSPTPTATPCVGQYVITQIEGSCVPGGTDIGNHGDDTVTTVALPFPCTLYDQTFNSINLSSNGNTQFTTTDNAGLTFACRGSATTSPSSRTGTTSAQMQTRAARLTPVAPVASTPRFPALRRIES